MGRKTMNANRTITESRTAPRERVALIAWTAALAAAGMAFAISTASAQVTPPGITPGGSVSNIVGSPTGATQNVATPSSVGDAAPGTLSISGGGTVLNMFDQPNADPLLRVDAELRVGTDNGTGRLVVNNAGALNVTASLPTSNNARLLISSSPDNVSTSQAGTVIIGDDPLTPGVENFGFLALRANEDAVLIVGQTGQGELQVNNSAIGLTAIGGPTSAAVLNLGGGGNGDAVGNLTANNNASIVVDAQGGGAAVVSVGRATDTVANPNAALAPENTLLLQSSSELRITANTGTSFLNVGRDGGRGTATVDGVTSRIEIDDFVQVGRNGGFGTLNVRSSGEVDNFAAGAVSETRIGASGTGTLNIETGGTYTTRTLAIGQGAGSDGTVNVDGNGSVLRQNSDGALVPFTLVGQDGVGRLNVTNGGDVIVDDPNRFGGFQVGVEVGSNGTVTVDGAGSSITAGRVTSIGRLGAGALSVSNGGTFQTSRLFAAQSLGGTGQVDIDGAGSALNLLGTDGAGNGPLALIGRDGVATMDVTNGAVVNLDPNGEAVTGLSGGLLIGGASSATGAGNGTVNVTGAGSAINIANPFASMQVGRNGIGALNITGGGKITNAPGDGVAIVGRTGISTGTVLISGTDSEWQAGSHLFVGTEIDFTNRFVVAGGGSGSITVEDGGTLGSRSIFIENGNIDVNSGGTMTGRLALLGSDAGTTSELNVSGAGSRVDLTGNSPSGSRAALVIGDEGKGTLNITNGGKVEVNADPEPGRASVINLGGSLNTTQATGEGIANIDGAGSELRLSSGQFVLFQVGRFGKGTLNVTNGGSVVVEDPDKEGQFRIGRIAGSDGTVNVNGAGSSIIAGRETRVGQEGTGVLNVTNGGSFQTARLFSSFLPGGQGDVTVDGLGSQLNLRGTDEFGNGPLALIGRDGVSTMNVTNGATVNMDPDGEAVTGLAGGLLIGGASTATGAGNGTVNVTGPGSAINIGNQNASIQVGRNGTGALNISGGGKITNAPGNALSIVGRTSNSVGTVNVTGAGSEWDAGANLFIGTDVDFVTRTAIGNGGEGTVNIANGGRLVADDIVNAARGTITGGGGTIVGNLTNDGGTIAAGNSPGLMSVIGNVDLLGGGTVEIELGGTVFDSGVPQFDYDRIDVTENDPSTGADGGTVTIATGALFDIDFFGAFTAGLGDTFDVIVADEIDVADLASLIFDFSDSALLSGLLWDIDIVAFGQGREALQLSVVAQQAVPEPAAALILIGGLGAMIAIRRRRHR